MEPYAEAAVIDTNITDSFDALISFFSHPLLLQKHLKLRIKFRDEGVVPPMRVAICCVQSAVFRDGGKALFGSWQKEKGKFQL